MFMIRAFVLFILLFLCIASELFQSQCFSMAEQPEIDITEDFTMIAFEPSSSHSEPSLSHDTAAGITKKRSLVWAYFRKSSKLKEVICNLCEEKVVTCGNTTNMVKVSHYNCYVNHM